jgi:dTDP-4-amino-4,6-dideoxygalactose transaminase
MDSIKMVDLYGQYFRIKEEVDSAIQEVIRNTSFVKGEEVQLFEKELGDYLGVRHVIACANGTDALQIALMALELKQGDEVITADFTFVATAEVIALMGMIPVLADVNRSDFLINPDEIEKKITSRTKAIIPVHLFGQCADMERITDIARKYKLFVIEDNAQALGADYNGSFNCKAGTIGEIGCTSFFPSKNLGCFGDGGALYTNNDELAARIRSIANHGMTRRYFHDHIGVNSRLDGIQAAILRVKLRHLDEYNRLRSEAAARYDKLLSGIKGIEVPARTEKSNHIFHQYTLKCKATRRDEIIEKLKDRKIPAMIYYPVPLHGQKAYAHYGFVHEDYPVTSDLCREVFSLPMHTELTVEEQDYICRTLSEIVR